MKRRTWFVVSITAAILAGYAIRAYVGPVLGPTGDGTDPSVVHTFAVVKSPDEQFACVVTRQSFYPPDFYTFAVWYLDPHTKDLLFPVDGPAEIVRQNIEEGPPTEDICLKWSGNDVVATFYWGDGSPYGPEL